LPRLFAFVVDTEVEEVKEAKEVKEKAAAA
jgi:hypothetical protein